MFCFVVHLFICFSSFFFVDKTRWETVPVLVGRLSMEVRPFRRTDPPLPQTHRRQTVQMCPLWTKLLPIRPLGPAPQTPPIKTNDDPSISIYYNCKMFVLPIISISFVCLFVCFQSIIATGGDAAHRTKLFLSFVYIFLSCFWKTEPKIPKWAKRSNLNLPRVAMNFPPLSSF